MLSKIRFTAALVAALVVGLVATGAHADPTGLEIAEKAQKVTKLAGSEMVSTLVIINAKGKKRVRKIAGVTKVYDDGTEKRLIRFLEPADVKGTGLLTFDYEDKDDDIWLFMPALKKTRRIVSKEKAKNFMGSEFTYADMTPPPLDDFTFTNQGSETVDGVDCWIIESVSKNDDVVEENGFSKRVSWIAKEDYIPRKVVYYDKAGKLWKELTSSDVKLVDEANKKYRPYKMVMVNKQNGRKSEMIIDKLEVSADIPDKYFTTTYLETF